MRAVLVTTGDPTRNPRSGSLARILTDAGHDVAVVSPPVPTRMPGVRHIAAGAGRLRSVTGRDADREVGVARAARKERPAVVYPLRERDIAVAGAVGAGAVVTPPMWEPAPQRDLVWAGTANQWLAGTWRSDGTHGTNAAMATVHLVARFTATTPARYLAAAFERLGSRVVEWDGGIEWVHVEPGSVVVFVESPYPALTSDGVRLAGVPVLFWAHHGEHHQRANIRLSRRYGASAVLMAHSWHLAHQYPQPVYAIPFGVPVEEAAADVPFADRTWDVSMVGAGLDATDGWYARRGARARAIRACSGLSSNLAYGVTPPEMMRIYGDSRIVVNDGGAQHRPITMRAFEALGSGALLATEPAPGLSELIPDTPSHLTLHTTGADELLDILRDPSVPALAAEARVRAMAEHTYDDRAQRMLEIATDPDLLRTEPQVRPDEPTMSALARAVDLDVDVQSVAHVGGGDLAEEIPDRDVRSVEQPDQYGDASFDAVAISQPGAPPGVARLARSYVYVATGRSADVDAVGEVLGGWLHREVGGVHRFDARVGGYRVRPDDHPLS